MRHNIYTMMAAVLCIGFVGCRSVPKTDSEGTVFDYMQDQVSKITSDGGMAALGIGESGVSPQLAITRASVEARKNMAQLVQVKIKNLEMAFIEEVGKVESAEVSQLFSSATKQVTSQELLGSAPKMQKFDEKDGIYTAYVLMVMNPDIVHKSLKSSNNAQHLYERFRASKAFEELDKEIKAFEASEYGIPPGA